MSDQEHSHAPLAGDHFSSDASLMERIHRLGMAEFVEGLDGLACAFQPEDANVRCIDEGTEGGIPLAGSGILLGIERTVEFFLSNGVEGVYSHTACGAAVLFCEQNGIDPIHADDEAIRFAQSIAARTGARYMGHIGLLEMARPATLHTARVAFVDGTQRFDPKDADGFPVGFTLDRHRLEKDYALSEVQVACDIALGPHGFGHLFTPEDPFLLIAIGDPTDERFSEEVLRAELDPIAAPFEGRVRVDGFTPPKRLLRPQLPTRREAA